MSAVLDLDQAGDNALTDTVARRLLASKLGPTLRRLILAEDATGDVYHPDLLAPDPLTFDRTQLADGPARQREHEGHALTGRTGGAS